MRYGRRSVTTVRFRGGAAHNSCHVKKCSCTIIFEMRTSSFLLIWAATQIPRAQRYQGIRSTGRRHLVICRACTQTGHCVSVHEDSSPENYHHTSRPLNNSKDITPQQIRLVELGQSSLLRAPILQKDEGVIDTIAHVEHQSRPTRDTTLVCLPRRLVQTTAYMILCTWESRVVLDDFIDTLSACFRTRRPERL